MERKYTADEMMDMLIEMGIDPEFINGAVCVGGHNEETFERILFYFYGYHTFEGMMEDYEEDPEDATYYDDVDESFYDPYMGCDCYE